MSAYDHETTQMRYRRPLSRVTGLTADTPWDDVPELVSGDNLSFIAGRPLQDRLFRMCHVVFLFFSLCGEYVLI